MSDRNALRSSLLRSRPPEFKVVEFEGEKYAIRRPKVGQKGDLIFSAGEPDGKGGFKVNPMKFQLQALIACLYTVAADGGPGVPVFEPTDYDALAEQESGGIVDALGPECASFIHGGADKGAKEAAKNG